MQRVLNLRKKVKREQRKERVKNIFRNERRLSRLLFAILMIIVVLTVTGSGVFAYFKRSAADGNFGYGYGYGYDGAGYGYGYGYGYGASVSGNWNYGFWGNDGSASSVSAARSGSTGLKITYSTDYYAKNKVYYGTSNTGTCSTLGSNSSQSGFQTGSNSITVSGLTCGTTYYYCVASEDAGGNAWYSGIKSKATGNCAAGEEEEETGGGAVIMTPVFQAQQAEQAGAAGGAVAGGAAPATHFKVSRVSGQEGGTMTMLTSEGNSLRVEMPEGLASDDLKLKIRGTKAGDLIAGMAIGRNPAGLTLLGARAFQVTITDLDGNKVENFAKPVELQFAYTDRQMWDFKEETLRVYEWNGSEWISLGSNVDAESNTVTTEVNAFSWFAVFGEEKTVQDMGATELRARIKRVAKQLIVLLTKQILMLIERIVEALAKGAAGLVG